MSVFAGAVATMFRDRNMSVPAVWRAGDTETPLRVIRKSPDVLTNYGQSALISDQTIVDVMVSAAPSIAVGDTLTIGTDWFVVQSDPMRDRERLTFTLDLRQVPPPL